MAVPFRFQNRLHSPCLIFTKPEFVRDGLAADPAQLGLAAVDDGLTMRAAIAGSRLCQVTGENGSDRRSGFYSTLVNRDPGFVSFIKPLYFKFCRAHNLVFVE